MIDLKPLGIKINTMQNIEIKRKSDSPLMSIAGGQYRIIISGKETDDRYAIIEMNVPPGGGPAPHSHNQIEELFYVVEGMISFYTENGNHTAQPGDLIRIPINGGIHAFKNTSNKFALLICTVYPAGLDEMFERISQNQSNAKAILEEFGNKTYSLDYFDKDLE